MAFAFIQSNSAQDDNNDNSASVGMTVTAGNLVVGMGKWEVGTTTLGVSDGTTGFTMRSVNPHSNNDLNICFGYLPSANGGAQTYTFTWGANRPFKWVHVREYSYTGTASFDVDDVTAEGSGTTVTTGAITTTGTDEVVIMGVGFYQSVNYGPGQTIGGSAAGNGLGTTGTTAYTADRILTATMSSGAGVVGTSASNDWVGSLISFKATAGGGGGGQILSGGGILSGGILTGGALIGGNGRNRSTVFFPDFARTRKLAFL